MQTVRSIEGRDAKQKDDGKQVRLGADIGEYAATPDQGGREGGLGWARMIAGKGGGGNEASETKG